MNPTSNYSTVQLHGSRVGRVHVRLVDPSPTAEIWACHLHRRLYSVFPAVPIHLFSAGVIVYGSRINRQVRFLNFKSCRIYSE